MKTPSTPLTRRTFLAGSAAGAALVLKPDLVFGTAANSKLRLGLVGCGGRGMWIADLFQQSGLYEWVSGADFFADRVNAFGDKFGLPAGRRHTGLAAHRRLLEDPVDAVVIQSPPYFHPQQSMDAVEAGKHVFLAKPVAVDAWGCQTIGEAGRKATAQRLVFLVDFQTRASAHYREALRMVRHGDIGDLVMVESHYPWRGGGRGAPPTTPADRLRSWYYVLELSGDFIVEQSIHALDVATWIVDADPIRATGVGGRKVRPPSSIYDHFVLRYDFPGDLAMSFTCIQAIPEVRDEIRARAFGTDGVIDTDYYSGVVLRGKEAYRGDEPNLYTTGTEVNVREFHQAIATGQFHNPTVAPSVRSNLTAVLGREAAYRRGAVTLAELVREDHRLEPDFQGLKI